LERKGGEKRANRRKGRNGKERGEMHHFPGVLTSEERKKWSMADRNQRVGSS
jgi:hypothetical protein